MSIRLLTRAQVAGLLAFPDYVEGVSRAFRLHADGHVAGAAVDARGRERR